MKCILLCCLWASFLLLCPLRLLESSEYRWEAEAGETLSLVGPYGVIWSLHYGDAVDRPYFHPVNTTRGQLLTDYKPVDHPWHHGLWFSWKYVNGVNFWEYLSQKNHRQKGEIRIQSVRLDLDSVEAVSAVITMYYFPDREGAPVLEEVVTLELHAPEEDGSYTIDWTVQSLALEPVELNRTPIPGEPDGKFWGGYAGLSYRGSDAVENLVLVDSEGRTDPFNDFGRHPARWFLHSGEFGGSAASIAILDHPENLNHPVPWHVSNLSPTKEGPRMTFMNAAVMANGPIRLEMGDELQLSYRVLVFDRAVSPEDMDQAFESFARKPEEKPLKEL